MISDLLGERSWTQLTTLVLVNVPYSSALEDSPSQFQHPSSPLPQFRWQHCLCAHDGQTNKFQLHKSRPMAIMTSGTAPQGHLSMFIAAPFMKSRCPSAPFEVCPALSAFKKATDRAAPALVLPKFPWRLKLTLGSPGEPGNDRHVQTISDFTSQTRAFPRCASAAESEDRGEREWLRWPPHPQLL